MSGQNGLTALYRGLGSSRWAPINTGQPPYYYCTSKTVKKSTSTSTSTTTSTTSTTSICAPGSETSPQPSQASQTAQPPLIPPIDETSTYSSSYTATATAHRQPRSSALHRIPTPWSELTRFMQIARRMRWKLPFLGEGYRKATNRTFDADGDRSEAELMFKLDFFEYYMLLERALVHLMGVFGIQVTGGLGSTRAAGNNTNRNMHGRGWVEKSNHRFHANVLEALQDPQNPLHEVLGNGDACYALMRAKELRNRWKNADDSNPAISGIVQRMEGGGQTSRPLEDYDLEWILEAIFNGLDKAYRIADNYAAGVQALAPPSGSSSSTDMLGEPTDESQWDFMVDAMDWERV